MTLTNLLRNKIGALVLGTALRGCTYETYNVGEGNGPVEQQIELNSCEDLAAYDFQCNPQAYQKHLDNWGVSFEDQIKHAIYECEKGNWFVNVPEFITCAEQNSCDYYKANCGQFLEDAGF